MITDIRMGRVTIELDNVNVEEALQLIDRCKDYIKKESETQLQLSSDGRFIEAKVNICQAFNDILKG